MNTDLWLKSDYYCQFIAHKNIFDQSAQIYLKQIRWKICSFISNEYDAYDYI